MKTAVIAFSAKGCETAKRIAKTLKCDDLALYSKTSLSHPGIENIRASLKEWTATAFSDCDAIIFVGAVGIAVRAIAPFVVSKTTDPAVISVDELGKFSVPVLSGHIGGANDLAKIIASGIGATPVVTTATDINGKIAIDSFAVKNDMAIENIGAAKDIAAKILADEPVGLVSDFPIIGNVPDELSGPRDSAAGVYIGEEAGDRFDITLTLVPRRRTLGIGCRKGISEEAIEKAVADAISSAGISMDSIRAAASIDLKKDEAGLLEFSVKHGIPMTFYTSSELNSVPGEFSSSDFVRSVTDVDCVCERSAVKISRNGRLILKKYAENGVTVAIAEEDFSVDFTKGRFS